jgi:hypothetical protein
MASNLLLIEVVFLKFQLKGNFASIHLPSQIFVLDL